VLKRAFLTVNDVAAVVRVEVTWVAKHLEEAADSLLGLLLRLLLHVDCFVTLVERGKDLVDQFE